MHPTLVPRTKPGKVPHRLLEVFLKIYEVLGGLRRFGRMLRVFCMAMDGSAKLLSVCWTASRGVLGGLGEVLGVMLESKREAKPRSYRKKCCSKRQKVPKEFFDGFCIENKQSWRPKICI